MLYISRRVGGSQFGVVDTDDNTEEVISGLKLAQLIRTNGLQVAGVVHAGKEISMMLPYQLPETYTQAQAKLKLMRNVDITLYGDMITCIRWNPSKTGESSAVRLSDYGHVLGDMCFEPNGPFRTHVVTFIFDDSLSFMPDAFLFTTTKFKGLKFDLRELCDDNALFVIKCVSMYGYNIESEAIIDRRERYTREFGERIARSVVRKAGWR